MKIKRFNDILNESLNDDKFDKIFKKYSDKDYFGWKEAKNKKVEEWKHFCDKGDKDALATTEDDITNYYIKVEREEFDEMVNRIKKLVDKKDVQGLISRVRYDQVVSKEIYEVLTGDNIKSKTNVELKKYFEEKYK